MGKILFVNQVFYPDEVAVSQFVSTFVFASAKHSSTYTVICGQRDWENPSLQYKSRETINGVNILRLQSTAFTKKSRFGRLINFVSFQVLLCIKLIAISKNRTDLVVCSTVPPMLPIITSIICKLKNIPFVYWIMDLQPDEAIAAGYIKEKSIAARMLQYISMIPLKYARSIIVLDRFMKRRLEQKKINDKKIVPIGLWPVIPAQSQYDGESFRKEQGFGSKIVIMYSGNHSICHPLDTLLESALTLREDNRFLFVFIGAGVRKQDVKKFAFKHNLDNILQLPYQPQEKITRSLDAADIHIVVQGNEFSGLVHPSKVYGIFAIGKPFVFIGPKESHIGDMINESGCGRAVDHGDVDACVTAIRAFTEMESGDLESLRSQMQTYIVNGYSEEKQIGLLEKVIHRV